MITLDDMANPKDVELKYTSSAYKFKDERLISYYEAEDLRYAD